MLAMRTPFATHADHSVSPTHLEVTMREAIVVNVAYYIDEKGRRPFIDWVKSLDPDMAETVHDAVEKRRVGNTGGSKRSAAEFTS